MTTPPNSEERWAVGSMCGTSLDGIDVAAVRFDPLQWPHSIQVVDHLTLDFTELDAERVRAIASGEPTDAEELSSMRFQLAREEERGVRELCRRMNVAPEELEYVAAHGITVCHRPQAALAHGWQLHAGAVLAARLGCRVVDEFRAGDLALDGQGAPLAPLADLALRSSDNEHRAVLNLGGIANISVLPRGSCQPSEVICGDVGPANLPLDELARRHLQRPFDQDGRVARQGTVDEAVLEDLAKAEWVRRALPRSFGREEFGGAWVDALQARMASDRSADVLATVVALEVLALQIFLEEFVPTTVTSDGPLQVYVTGGGRHHRGWWERAAQTLDAVVLHGIEELGVSADAKEAVDFAFLGGQTLLGHCAEQSVLTGAREDLVLGSVHDPHCATSSARLTSIGRSNS